MNKATKIILYFVIIVIGILSVSMCVALTLYCDNPIYVVIALGLLCSLLSIFSTLRTLANLANSIAEQEVEDDNELDEHNSNT